MAETELRYLNEQAMGSYSTMIARAEAAWTAALRYICTSMLERGDRLLMLAGPSSSGKTTTANLLADLFRSRGHEAQVVSLDHFYRATTDPDYPRLPDGSRDYECVEALRIDRIHDTIEGILEGKDQKIPRFDFKRGEAIEDAIEVKATEGGIVILEGLHALNPILTRGLPEKGVYRLFVSVSTNLTENGERILSGRKLRFVRRLVRDSIFRASDADKTLSMWPHVLHGEDLYLYPYKETADFKLNTFHSFEPGVLALRALELLADAKNGGEYAEIVRAALEKVVPIPQTAVPTTSLIREFTAGGIYESVY